VKFSYFGDLLLPVLMFSLNFAVLEVSYAVVN